MIAKIALYPFLGQALFLGFGQLGFLLLIFTASISFSNRIGKPILPFKWHPRMAKVTIAVVTIHAVLAASVLYNF
jgi:hypothetical protein